MSLGGGVLEEITKQKKNTGAKGRSCGLDGLSKKGSFH